MDPVSAGASVLAFITVALQSAKTISNFLAGIKDGPENVARAITFIAMLQGTLTQLAQCPASNQAILNYIKSCSEDLANVASKLSKFQLLNTDGSSRKALKRIRTTFHEKELDRIVTTMGTHSSILSLCLQYLERSSRYI